MKKSFLILAVGSAILGFTSCSKDEKIAENNSINDANEISFRTFVTGNTRATDATPSSLTAFKAYAKMTSGGTVYFNEDVFTKVSETYTSTTKHYWPSEGALDFYAYAPTDNAQITNHTAQSLTFTVTPADEVSSQVDLIVANTDNKTKIGTYNSTQQYGKDGIPLNFRHTESKIVVNFKNTQANLKIDVQAFKIVNVDGSATFTFADADADANTDTHNSQLAGGWTGNADGFNKTYTVIPTNANTIAASTTTAVYLQNGGTPSTDVNAAAEMILIPQTTTTADAYSAADINSTFPAGKTYIAVKMQIKNNDATGTVIADATADGKWAIWPVAFTWTPGKKYTYIVDLGDGGYWEKNDDTNVDLDPVLDDAIIKFVSVTVDDWSAEAAINVPALP